MRRKEKKREKEKERQRERERERESWEKRDKHSKRMAKFGNKKEELCVEREV